MYPLQLFDTQIKSICDTLGFTTKDVLRYLPIPLGLFINKK